MIDLRISIDHNSHIEIEIEKKFLVESREPQIKLTNLNHLDALTIEGTPKDLSNLKELILAARNLSVLVIDLDCLLKILENENESLILYVFLHRQILYLCIRIPDSIVEEEKLFINDDQLHLITRIFSQVRNLTIDYESSKQMIHSKLIHTIIQNFPHLVIFHVYGKISEEIPRENIRLWLIQENSSRIKETDLFQVECTDDSFKLWL